MNCMEYYVIGKSLACSAGNSHQSRLSAHAYTSIVFTENYHVINRVVVHVEALKAVLPVYRD